MVYIGQDGQVLQSRPWNMARVLGIFTGLWFFLVHFMRTLFAPFQSEKNESSGSGQTWGSGWGSGGGGGGGGGGGSGGNGRGGPGGWGNRRIGRISHTSSISACPGGACGR